MRSRNYSLVMALSAALMGSSAGAATFNVQTSFDYPDMNPGDGSCIAVGIGLCTLRAAIQEANALPGNDIINLPVGHYVLTIAGRDEDAAATGDLDITGTVSVYGTGAQVTTIDANAIDRVFDLRSGTLELVGVTITGGSATTATSALGGGIRADGNLLVLGGCRILDNTANLGGGISSGAATGLQIADTLLAGNSTQALGFANPWGAAIRAEGGLTLESSTVTANVGSTPGYFAVDVQCFSGSVSILNSTIALNQASGIGTYNCGVSILHASIVDNATYGLVLGSFDNSHSRVVTNSINAGNQSDCNMAASAAVVFQYSLDSDGSCASFAGAGYLSATDPQLLPLRYWGGFTPTMHPKPVVSPVIDSGSANACYLVDQRGEVRGGDGNGDGTPGCDMGSVEAVDLLFYDGFEDGTSGPG